MLIQFLTALTNEKKKIVEYQTKNCRKEQLSNKNQF